MEKPDASGPRHFATTHWSVVLAVQDDDPARAREALEKLCTSYWSPLYSYLRHRGHPPPDSEDLIQGFFEMLLERETLKQPDPGRGRFRSFLLSCLNHYVADQLGRARRQKRGGGRPAISLDIPGAEEHYRLALGHEETPERLYERQWAITTVMKVLEQLRVEANAQGQGPLLERIEGSLSGEKPSLSFPDLASHLGLSEAAARAAAHRLRERYRVLFRQEIAHTVDRPEEVEEEIAHLFRVLGR